MRPRLHALLITSLILSLFIVYVPTVFADSQIHVVQSGETLFRISLKYGVTVQAIQAANGLSGNIIHVGQRLIIPDPNAPAIQPAAQTGPVVHIVQRGETLSKIGLKYNISWTAIQAANGLAGTSIYTGQQLIIPGSSATNPNPQPTQAPAPDAQPTEPPPTQPPAENSGVVHVVQRGETLFMIGLKYNLRWTAIHAANNLNGTVLYPGQRLIIPKSTSSSANPAPPPENTTPPAGDGKRFLVDISEQRLYAFEGETQVRTTLVSTGRWPYPTVLGTFQVYLRYTSASMRGPGYFLPGVPYVMYFYKGYGLHGTYWHSNFGQPMSHGCVNMPTPEAEWAYNWSTYGTTVIVQN